MFRAPVRSIALVFMVVLLLAPRTFSFDTSLSDQAIREAYFLGQRRDQKTVEFLDKYRLHLAVPESGPWVSTVELFTPYAEAVELSRQRSIGYSAQDALQDYHKSGDRIRVTITIEFNGSYGSLIQADGQQRSGSARGFTFRSTDFWKEFSYRLFEGDDLVEPIEMHGSATFRTVGDGTEMTGAAIVLLFDAEKISSTTDAAVVVDIPDHPQVVAPFDLTTLR